MNFEQAYNKTSKLNKYRKISSGTNRHAKYTAFSGRITGKSVYPCSKGSTYTTLTQGLTCTTLTRIDMYYLDKGLKCTTFRIGLYYLE